MGKRILWSLSIGLVFLGACALLALALWNFRLEYVTGKGGIQLVLEVPAPNDCAQAKRILEGRVRSFGVLKPQITASGAGLITLILPGVDGAEQARLRRLLTTPGHLEKWLVAKEAPIQAEGFPSREATLAHFGGQLPLGTELLPRPVELLEAWVPGQATRREEAIGSWILVESKVYVDGGDITDARRSPDPNSDQSRIHFTLNAKGARDFYALTQIASVESRLIVITLDRKIFSVLACPQPIIGRSVEITGSKGLTRESAEDFATMLKSGALGGPLTCVEERPLDPDLGRPYLRLGSAYAAAGLLAMAAALAAFLVSMYRMWRAKQPTAA